MKERILAVVVTYNRKKLLKECIEALLQTEGSFDLLVVDNHSTDGTERYLKENGIAYIRLEKNMGGAGGFYTGVKAAVKKGYEYLWLMDDDTIPERESLQALCHASSILNGNYGFLCSYVKWTDNEPCIMNLPRIGMLNRKEDIALAANGILKCESASFVSMFLKTDTIKKTGLPIKEFFIWGDDVEFSERLCIYKSSYFVLNSVVLHKMKNNLPADIVSDSLQRMYRYSYLFRNKTYMARMKGLKGRIKHINYMIYQIARILRCSKDYKGKRIRVLLRGWILGCLFHPEIEYCEYKDIR